MEPVNLSFASLRLARAAGGLRPEILDTRSNRSNSSPEQSASSAFSTLRGNLKGLAVEAITVGVPSPVRAL